MMARALLSVGIYPLNLGNTEDIENGLWHMTVKPIKNGRKYVDAVDGEYYLVRAHVWPSIRKELLCPAVSINDNQ